MFLLNLYLFKKTQLYIYNINQIQCIELMMTHYQAVMWLTGPAMCFCLLLPSYSINVFLHISGSLYLIFPHVLTNINISYLTCVLLKKNILSFFNVFF